MRDIAKLIERKAIELGEALDKADEKGVAFTEDTKKWIELAMEIVDKRQVKLLRLNLETGELEHVNRDAHPDREHAIRDLLSAIEDAITWMKPVGEVQELVHAKLIDAWENITDAKWPRILRVEQ